MEMLHKELSGCETIRWSGRNTDEAKFLLDKVGYDVSFFYIHLHGVNTPKLLELLKEIRKKNTRAEIFIDGLALDLEDFREFQQQYGRINLSTYHFSDEELKKAIEEDYAKWQDAAAARRREAQAPAEAPKRPEKINILWLEDEFKQVEQWRKMCSSKFSKDEYEFFFVPSYEKANRALETGVIDAAVIDVRVAGKQDERKEFDTKIKGVAQIIAISGYFKRDAVKMLANRWSADVMDRVVLITKSIDPNPLILEIEQFRQKQLAAFDEALAKRAAHPASRNDFRLAIYDYHNGEFKDIEDAFKNKPNCTVVTFGGPGSIKPDPDSAEFVADAASGGDGWYRFRRKIIEYEYDVDFVVVHLGYGGNAMRVDELVREVKKKNPEATIVVVTKRPEGLMGKLVKEKMIILIPEEEYDANRLISSIGEDLAKRDEAHSEAASPDEEPKRPEKLRALYVDDDLEHIRKRKTLLGRVLSEDKYQFTYAITVGEALAEIEKTKFDLIIYDAKMPNFNDDLKSAVLTIPFAVIHTGLLAQEAKRTVGENVFDHSRYIAKPSSVDGFCELIKQYRQKQIKTHETVLAKWRAAQAPAASPAKPEKLRVLYVNDLADNFWAKMHDYKDSLGLERKSATCYESAEYEFYHARNRNDVEDIIGIVDIDYAIVDWVLSGVPHNTIFAFSIVDALRKKNVARIDIDSIEKNVNNAREYYPDIKMGAFPHPFDVEEQIARIREMRIEQLTVFDETLAKWQATQILPAKPEKIRILVLDDDKEEVENLREIFKREMDSQEYEFIFVETYREAFKTIDRGTINAAMVDIAIPDDGEMNAFDEAIQKIPQVAIYSALTIDYDIMISEIAGRWKPEFIQRATKIEKPVTVTDLLSQIKQFRQRQLEAYEKTLVEWQATYPEPQKSEGQTKKTVFILNNSSQEAADLQGLMQSQYGDDYNIVTMDSVWWLKRHLSGVKPDVVILDQFLDGKDELENSLQLVRENNPNTRIIITSEEAAVMQREKLESNSVIGVIEKPFYFRKTLSILDRLLHPEDSRDGSKIEPGTIPKSIPDLFPVAPEVMPDTERVHTTNFQGSINYMQAKEEAAPLIVALGTSWIKGYEKGRYLQYDALNPLLSDIGNCSEFKNAHFIVSDDKDLSAEIEKKMSEKGFGNARVIALAGEETITRDLVGLDNGKNVLFGVDNKYLTVDSYIRLMEMLEIAAHLALDPDTPPNSPNIPIEKRGNFWIFVPRAEPIDYEQLKVIYEVQKFA